MKLKNSLRDLEERHYIEIERYRLFGCDAERISEELSHQFEDRIFVTFIPYNKVIMASIYNPNITATEIYTAIENFTDEEIKVDKKPDRDLVEFYTFKYGLSVNVTLYTGGNKRCHWEEVGKQEVPIYELKCEEE